MVKDNITFDDGSNYFETQKKEEMTYESIVLKHIQKITTMACVEYRGGFWQTKTKTSRDGTVSSEKIYVPDTREEISNAIEMLHDLMMPVFENQKSRDKGRMKARSKEIYKRVDELRIKCLKATKFDEESILGTKEGETMIMPIDSYGLRDRPIIEMYKINKLRLMRELFQELVRYSNDEWNWGITDPLTD